jgi:hypothetical protein
MAAPGKHATWIGDARERRLGFRRRVTVEQDEGVAMGYTTNVPRNNVTPPARLSFLAAIPASLVLVTTRLSAWSHRHPVVRVEIDLANAILNTALNLLA